MKRSYFSILRPFKPTITFNSRHLKHLSIVLASRYIIQDKVPTYYLVIITLNSFVKSKFNMIPEN